MAVILGKRKRRAEVEQATPLEKIVQRRMSKTEEFEDDDDDDDDDTARALFQKAFEARFKPLEKVEKPVNEPDEDLDDDEGDEEGDSDWDGLSEEEEMVEVVEHAVADLKPPEDFFGGKKSFMSSKPPILEDTVKAKRKSTSVPTGDEDGTETANLKNDLDLQRLLKESHLLDASSFRSSSAPDGKGRLAALDMRLQSLGARSSLLQQEKMPLSHRKGINSKNASREANRRKEAAENGVILERAQAAAKLHKKRERGLGGPGVGKFRGGTLKLSSRDVASIQGSRSSRGGKRGGKR